MELDGIFKGGGALGAVYLGCTEYLQRNGVWFARTAGTSAGSIIAGLIAAGYKTVCEDRHDCTTPGHSECIKGLLFTADTQRVARLFPSAAELKAMVPHSTFQAILDAALDLVEHQDLPVPV
jgi:hypothetical protein